MDSAEKEVLKKKEYLLVHHMTWNPTLVEALQEQQLVGEEQLAKIQKSSSNGTKTKTLAQHLKFTGMPRAVEYLAGILDYTRVSFEPDATNPWLSDELREEVKAERKDLVITTKVMEEARQIVFREFGHAKRLSEWEKKVLVEMVSRVTQCQENVWRAQCDRLLGDIEVMQGVLSEKRDICSQLKEAAQEFLQSNQHRVADRGAHRKNLGKSTSVAFLQVESPDHLLDPDKPLIGVEESIDEVISMLTESMLNVETLDAERDRVLERVGLPKSRETKMGEELDDAIRKTAEELADAKHMIFRKEQLYKDKIVELEEERVRQDKLNANQLKALDIILKEYQRKKGHLFQHEEATRELRRQVRSARTEHKEAREQYVYLESGDRLNYIVKRDRKALKGNKTAMSMNPNTSRDDDDDSGLVDYEAIFVLENGSKKPYTPRNVKKESLPPLRRSTQHASHTSIKQRTPRVLTKSTPSMNSKAWKH